MRVRECVCVCVCVLYSQHSDLVLLPSLPPSLPSSHLPSPPLPSPPSLPSSPLPSSSASPSPLLPSPPLSQLPTAMLWQHSMRCHSYTMQRPPVMECMMSPVKWVNPVAMRYPPHQHFPPPMKLYWVNVQKMTKGCCRPIRTAI